MKIRVLNGIHPWLKWVLIAGFAIFLTSAAAFTYFYVYFSHFIDRRLNGPIFANTSRIYAAPVPVFVGQDIGTAEIAGELRRAGYTEAKSNRTGWYHLVPGGIEVFPGPDSYFQDEPGLIKVDRKAVTRIVSLRDNTDRQRYDLEPEVVTNLFDRARVKRRLVKFEDLPPNLVNAVVAVEDRNFFSHSGVDYLRVIKAGFDDLRGKKLSGASTISMQFAGGYFLDRRDRSWRRKLPEVMITIELENRFSKKEIFEMYINQVNFGQRGSFSIDGIGEAALAYFDKDVKQLTLPECALLAGMVNGPSVLSPYRHQERARERRNLVLAAMTTNGYISPEARDDASRMSLGVVPATIDTGDAPYFVDLVKDHLLEKYSEKDLTSSSLKIYTGLDLELQKIASEAITEGIKVADGKLASFRRKHPKEQEVQVALVCLDPHTGEIKALQGGRNYGASQLNRAISKRQPGSSFKPITYAAAFNSAIDGSKPLITPSTVVVDEPTVFTFNNGRSTYEPDNFKQESLGATTLRNALAHSSNIATIKVGLMAGLEKVVDLARALGLHNVEATPAVAIGSYDATPIEMAGVYTAFANGGEFLEPVLVRAVKAQDGTTIEEHKIQPKRVLDPRVAYLMTNMMEYVMDHGTAASSRTMGFRAPAAGKTGSSRDAWFAGYTSNLLLVVWVGFDDNTNLPLPGAVAALPVWVEFMKRATKLRRYRDTMPFEPPTGIVSTEIDADTGMLATPWCPNRKLEIYIEGGVPTELCTTHNRQPGRLGMLSSVLGGPPPVVPPPAVPVTSASEAAAAVGLVGTPAEGPPGDAPKKKRGFFSRILGIGKDSNPPDTKKDKPPKPNQ